MISVHQSGLSVFLFREKLEAPNFEKIRIIDVPLILEIRQFEWDLIVQNIKLLLFVNSS